MDFQTTKFLGIVQMLFKMIFQDGGGKMCGYFALRLEVPPLQVKYFLNWTVLLSGSGPGEGQLRVRNYTTIKKGNGSKICLFVMM